MKRDYLYVQFVGRADRNHNDLRWIPKASDSESADRIIDNFIAESNRIIKMFGANIEEVV